MKVTIELEEGDAQMVLRALSLKADVADARRRVDVAKMYDAIYATVQQAITDMHAAEQEEMDRDEA